MAHVQLLNSAGFPCFGIAAASTLGATYDGADDQKHDINQVMLTIDIRAGFFDKGKMFNQGHGARLLHGGVIRSQTIGLFEFP
ncbi:hypothetical protein U876_17990 [Aeromonas hydrophila NJ-35]|nr:hypothetical protein V428_05980 [Aeromonas hydrophila subsp. hydrophila AL09-71]AHX68436.1 hypothetical protein V429_05980 [Aeromonas hydrophila pc104A]AJE38653.1 hypothetical protein V469_17365 [Aeromonas hydrophila J-1]AKJ37085.1 hypothetical protein U876_17990 [Aeromonas hydrophila NJ-35]ALQ64621.1 hypothetical protein AS145_17545 [Aeromonas hydrophila]ANB70407.1 hypothetical protein A6033_19245 [Aeromonas veronii]